MCGRLAALERRLGNSGVMSYSYHMSIQQLLINEVSRQPEPLLREVWHYLNFLKSKTEEESVPNPAGRPGFGSVPGIELAEDFHAPLEDFADYRPEGALGGRRIRVVPRQ